MQGRVYGTTYSIQQISCCDDGIVITLSGDRHLEFGSPEYHWELEGKKVKGVKFDPEAEAALLASCAQWYANSENSNDKENKPP